MKDKEPAADQGTNQTNIHKVPGWVKSARHTTRKRQPDASWQRVLVEQTLNRALEDPVTKAALVASLKRVLEREVALLDAAIHAFAMDGDDGYIKEGDGPGSTDFARSVLGDVMRDAIQYANITITYDLPREASDG